MDTAEPIIVAVIAVSSWIRSSRERARDPADTLAAEGELRFAIFDISLVLVCTGLYVLRFGSFPLVVIRNFRKLPLMNLPLVTLASRLGANLAHLYWRESQRRDCYANALHVLCLFAGTFKMCANQKATRFSSTLF